LRCGGRGPLGDRRAYLEVFSDLSIKYTLTVLFLHNQLPRTARDGRREGSAAGTIGYGGGFFSGLRFAYRPEDSPEWLGPLFPVCLVAGALGLLLLVSGLIVKFKIRG
jgi:hypothetical protein